ncbi:GNAT family N-acetyltransferase [Streptomyces sp. ME08-AFT2]|uniref:GNAT family N-acetyltransferase n=1 Tax=Streptomyces sp. ME08-AFT2 TaxID=3028683 RepID=UPI0029B271B8|nr:GNAT family N-acetyltransferase [Streptomyces sp. ME08-AFT2]MDX3313103.1 GNAT family N-acetyltransferase [Streptomyces sp. ME08-AFT2]
MTHATARTDGTARTEDTARADDTGRADKTGRADATASGPRLAEITPDNFEAATGIRVRPDQEFAVSPVMKSLAEAYVHPPGTAWPRLIIDGDRPVGFLMAFLDIDWTGGTGEAPLLRSGLWRLNIAAGEQGRGYGRFAVESVAAELRRRGAQEMYVTWHEGENGPEDFYLRLGFCKNGEKSDGETVGVLPLGRA